MGGRVSEEQQGMNAHGMDCRGKPSRRLCNQHTMCSVVPMVFSVVVLQQAFLPIARKCTLLTTPLPTLGISCLSDNSHSNRC